MVGYGSAMAISSQDVLHVARLANLSLSDDEVERMSEQLSGILGHVEALAALDLAATADRSRARDRELTRPDVRGPAGRATRCWRARRTPHEGMFRVPPTS